MSAMFEDIFLERKKLNNFYFCYIFYVCRNLINSSRHYIAGSVCSQLTTMSLSTRRLNLDCSIRNLANTVIFYTMVFSPTTKLSVSYNPETICDVVSTNGELKICD